MPVCGRRQAKRSTMAQKNRQGFAPKDARHNTVSITLSDRELAVIDEYCALFGQRSRASVIREGAVRFVRSKLIDEHTKLFTDEEPEPQPATPQHQYSMPSLFDFDFSNEDTNEQR